MKKWFFLCFLIVGLSSIFIIKENKATQIIINEGDTSLSKENIKLNVSKEQIYQGNLLLINKDTPIQQRFVKEDIVRLYDRSDLTTNYGLLNSEIKLSEEIAKRFLEMVQAAKEDKVSDFLISSGFRSYKEQEQLYLENGQDYALPAGYSEHNMGLGLDVGSTLSKMETATEGKWIRKNAWKYGFVLRYPKDKTEITGINYEPWHIRYVGLPHSAIMQEKNFVLEEYLDYLRNEVKLSVTIDQKSFQISYYPIQNTETIEIPNNTNYEISGNNMDGVIITTFIQ